jgi:hypothetical protein
MSNIAGNLQAEIAKYDDLMRVYQEIELSMRSHFGTNEWDRVVALHNEALAAVRTQYNLAYPSNSNNTPTDTNNS